MMRIDVTQEHWDKKTPYSNPNGCLLAQAGISKFGKKFWGVGTDYCIEEKWGGYARIAIPRDVLTHVYELYSRKRKFIPFSFYIDYGDEVSIDETKNHLVLQSIKRRSYEVLTTIVSALTWM